MNIRKKLNKHSCQRNTSTLARGIQALLPEEHKHSCQRYRSTRARGTEALVPEEHKHSCKRNIKRVKTF